MRTLSRLARPPFQTGNQPVNRITVIEPEPGKRAEALSSEQGLAL